MKRTEYPRFLFILLGLVLVFGTLAFSQGTGDSEEPEGVAGTEEAGGRSLVDHLWDAKEITIPQLFLFFLGNLLIVYHFLTLREGRLIQREFLRKVSDLVADGNHAGAQTLCEKVHGILPRVLAAGVRRREMGILAVSEGMAGVGSREMERLRQRIRYLSDIAQILILLGLLGTVWGMIQAFSELQPEFIQSQETVDIVNISRLGQRVSYALVTTAVGLVSAIIVSFFYYVFRGRVVRLSTQIEERAAEFAELIIAPRTKSTGRAGVTGLPNVLDRP